ncbi:MAG: hypothetical protein R2786_04775 [Flavobacteriaceae bacterium]
MKNLKSIVLLVFFNLSCGFGYTQTMDTIQKKHQLFFYKLTQNSGLWVAQNPDYNSNNKEDFKKFILKVHLKDSLQIDAEISGITTLETTVKFWTFSEFYAPDKKKNLFYQRSANGLYYATGEATMTNDERLCEMTFYYEGGAYLMHKDSHRFIDQNTMESLSYDYDTTSKEWILKSTLLWKRNPK